MNAGQDVDGFAAANLGAHPILEQALTALLHQAEPAAAETWNPMAVGKTLHAHQRIPRHIQQSGSALRMLIRSYAVEEFWNGRANRQE